MTKLIESNYQRRLTGPAGCLAAALLAACASGYDPDAPVRFTPTTAIPVDQALPHLASAVGQRITVSGLPRQREGRCSGVQPLTRKDWMLTGENGGCLWVSGQTDNARLLDLRPGMSKYAITVSGLLLRSDAGVYVLKLDP